jgi:ABC-type phosphate transport system substrate-binding protein
MSRPPELPPLTLAIALALATLGARADVVVVMGAASPVELLSADDVANIFLGKTETTASGARVVPIDQPEGAAARDAFYRVVTGKTPSQVRAYWARIIFTGKGQPPRQLDAAAVAALLATNPRAVAYVDRAAVSASMRIVYAPGPP